jgi:hypothetical protein
VEEKNYYVYLHLNALDEVFYIGTGKGDRKSNFRERSIRWKEIAKEDGVRERVVFDKMTRQEALQAESLLICFCKVAGIPLVNIVYCADWRRIFEQQSVLQRKIEKIKETVDFWKRKYHELDSRERKDNEKKKESIFDQKDNSPTELRIRITNHCQNMLVQEGLAHGIKKKPAAVVSRELLINWALNRIAK